MPKIVNKEEKRKEIAAKAYEFILEKGMKEFSTDALIKYMGIGKSSLYNYFKSKNEILYEIYSYVFDTYIEDLEIRLKNTNNLESKLRAFFKFHLIDIYENDNLKDLYKESVIMSIDDKTPNMLEFNKKLLTVTNNIIEEIIKQEITKGTIRKESLDFSEFILTSIDGILLYSVGIKEYDLKEKIENFIVSFIKIVEIK